MKHNRINVLDKGFVELINISGDDLTVINSARISYNKHVEHTRLKQADKNLLAHLAKNDHWTPFSHVTVRLKIKMPIFIARQYFKSTVGFSRNEVSRRYTNSIPELYFPDFLPQQKEKNKPIEDNELLLEKIDLHYQMILNLYEHLLHNGTSYEEARIILPMSTYTEFIETGNLYSYARLYKLRSTVYAQKQIREYINAIDILLMKQDLLSWEELKKYNKQIEK